MERYSLYKYFYRDVTASLDNIYHSFFHIWRDFPNIKYLQNI